MPTIANQIETIVSKSGFAYISRVTEERETEINFQWDLAGGATDLQKLIDIDVSRIVFLEIGVKGSGVTIDTNSSGTPDDTITLTDGQTIEWTESGQGGSGVACPLTVDVTSLFMTNSDPDDVASVYLSLLMDATAP